jgi:hypothetical protein
MGMQFIRSSVGAPLLRREKKEQRLRYSLTFSSNDNDINGADGAIGSRPALD